MRQMLLSIWRKEQGSTSLTMTWFMIVSLSLAIGLDSLFGVYIALQQGRSASDAAILATTRAIATHLKETVEEEAATRVESLVSDPLAAEEIEAELEALAESQEACDLDPQCEPKTEEELQDSQEGIKVRAYRRAFSRLYRGDLSMKMAVLIVKGTWQQADPVMKRDHLIPDDTDLGCLVERTAEEKGSEILQEAGALARANGARVDSGRSALAQPNGLHIVVISRTVRPFGAERIFPDGNYPQLFIPNAALLTKIGDRTPNYLPSC